MPKLRVNITTLVLCVFQRVKGLAEVDSMVKFLHRVIKHGEVEVHEEHHSAHEIVLVWTVTVRWCKKRNGKTYPTGHSFFMTEISSFLDPTPRHVKREDADVSEEPRTTGASSH